MKKTWSLVAALVSTASAAAQTTWYVDIEGIPPGSGTPGDPYTSVQFAIDRPTTINGDRIVVLPGTYTENIDYNGKQLEIESTGGPTVTTLFADDPNKPTVRLDSSFQPARFEGFAVTGSAHGIELVFAKSNAVIRRCIVFGNSETGLVAGYDARVESCTIANNGQGVWLSHAALFEMWNTIVWDNVQPSSYANTFGLRYNDLQENVGGTNISADPLFWNAAVADYHLMDGSPCIDTGSPQFPRDPDGTPIDIGALTFDGNYRPPTIPYCTAKTGLVCGTPEISWSGTPTAGASSGFVVRALPAGGKKAGLLLYSCAGRAALPFDGGLLCVAPPVRRTLAVSSGGTPGLCDGSFALDFNTFASGNAGGQPDPCLATQGQTVTLQWWGRDSVQTGSLLSAALESVMQ